MKTGKVVFLVFLIILSICASNIQPVKPQSSGTIYIRSDGSVEGTDKIQQSGEVYTFTANINGSIVVERDNIVIEGAEFTLQPQASDHVGINIRNRNGVEVRNLGITGFLGGGCGIVLVNSNDCSIYRNNITDNTIGIEMTDRSSRNRITENHVRNNEVGIDIYGVDLPGVDPGSDNSISENEVSNNLSGMHIEDFIYTRILGNKITSNTYGLALGLGSGSVARNNIMNGNKYGFSALNVKAVNVDVDTSNTVNGKPIYYWVNQHDRTVPADACCVALIGCTRITVKNLNLAGNLAGVFLGSTTYSTITNNRLSNNADGIRFDASSYNTVSGNTITNNGEGVGLCWSSSHNNIYGNAINANYTGIFITESASNNIIGNNISNSGWTGIYTQHCSGINVIHHNNFINNTKQWNDVVLTSPDISPISVSVWDDGKEGNHWDDYVGVDNDGNDIGDTPYVLGVKNQDNYPLIKPVNISGVEIPPIPEPRDTTSPTVSIISPENKTYTINNVPLTFTVNEQSSWIGYSLDVQANASIAGNTTLTGLSDGLHSLTVYTQDTAGNTGASETIYFSIKTQQPDTTPPVVSIVSPENKTYTVNNISLTYTLNEQTSWVSYSLDGKENVTITGNSTLTGLSHGSHSLTVYANDTAGNMGASEKIHFTITQDLEPQLQQSEAFPTTWIAVAIVIVVIGAAFFLVHFRRIKKPNLKAKSIHEAKSETY